ncbi:MAG: T9SS type A sorting domain-containing protein [Bacteroidales bacterium]
MKYIFAIAFNMSMLFSFGQKSNSIVSEGALWSTLEVHCMPTGNNYSTYHLKFEGDTLIDSHMFKSIWRCDEESQETWTFYGFIRENEDNQVFLKPPDYVEGLVYDFGVEIGDTVVARNVYLNSDTLHFLVAEIDSILLLDGYHKRITLWEYMNEKEEVWIEGLGSLYGILNSCNGSYGGVCGSYEALCYTSDDLLIYQHSDYTTCHYNVTVDIGLSSIEQMSVYPNPAKDFTVLEFSNDRERQVEIFDLSGKKITKNLLFDKIFYLNLHLVDKGTYIIKVNDGTNFYLPIKLIVD